MSSTTVDYVSDCCPVVLLNYSDISNPDQSSAKLLESIRVAYGNDGLGILVIRGIPKFQEYRAELLPLARSFALLPEETKKQYEHPISSYQFGWSHGKETLANNTPDYAKGSYYANPILDAPFADNPEKVDKYPSFCAPNIWPSKDLPALEPAFKQLGKLIVDTGSLLSIHIDRMIGQQCPTYTKNRLHNVIKTSRNPKARLLHYFPADWPLPNSGKAPTESKTNSDDIGSWCGWHNDHGSLTGLCSAMYFDQQGNSVANPDSKSGLYIRSRTGAVVKAVIPQDCLAFQMGETQQIHSGGIVQATPHCVNISNMPGVSRETFAVFMEPEIEEIMNVPGEIEPQQACQGSSTKYLPPAVPPLGVRWQNNINFGEFTNQTLAAYHPEESSTSGGLM
jgi:isopenicillin N synthase-like dioxygenase